MVEKNHLRRAQDDKSIAIIVNHLYHPVLDNKW